ncbi:MAG: c [Xanthobacteraceae bacterium]|jgi:phage repressor protein C with HTH and peptisase S24 domain|nr:c [Xanthobacteraceae bacterium]
MIFCPQRKDDAMQDIQDQLRAWMAAGFAKRGRGSKRELAHLLGIGEAAISKMLKPEKGKGYQTIELVWVPTMEAFFGADAPVSLQMRAPASALVQDNVVPLRRQSPVKANISAPIPAPELPERQIPVYGVAVGGSDGRMKFNGERLDMVGCPPELKNAANAYAVYVTGDSMVPSFKPGQLAWVNPNLSARIGDDVIVQLRPHDEADAPEGFIKELVKRTPTKLIVKQYNPEMEISFEQAEVLSVHVVVFASRR